MIAVSEQRCDHGFMRSMVRCVMCDAAEARAKPIDKLDRWQPITVVVPALPSFAFALNAPGVPYQPSRTLVPAIPYQLRNAPIPAAPASTALDPERVLEVVAAAYFISVAQLCAKDRHQSVAAGRLVAYWALRRLCNLSYPQVGRLIGGRNHTTVMAGVRKVEAKRLADARYRAHTDRILNDLGGVLP